VRSRNSGFGAAASGRRCSPARPQLWSAAWNPW